MKRVLMTALLLAACAKKKPAPPAAAGGGPIYAFIPIQGCSCQADVTGAGKETLELRLELKTAGANMFWHLDRDKGEGFELAPAAGMAPPPTDTMAADQLMGLGCDGPIVVVAAKQSISGWSASEHRLLWNKALGGDYQGPARGPDQAGEIVCQPLAVSAGKVTVAIAGGRSATLRMADGAGDLPDQPATPLPAEPPDASESDGR